MVEVVGNILNDTKIRIHIQKPNKEQIMSFKVNDSLITPKSIKQKKFSIFL